MEQAVNMRLWRWPWQGGRDRSTLQPRRWREFTAKQREFTVAEDRDMIGAKHAIWYPDEDTLHVSPAMCAFLTSPDPDDVALIARHLRIIDLADARVMDHY
jgi:hypothetical protein